MATKSFGPLRLLRETHEGRVLTALRTQGPLTRAQLADQTGLSRATLSSIVQTLLANQAVTEAGPSEAAAIRGRGRPVSVLTLNPAGGLAVGMDLGHRRIQVTVANVAHEIVASDGIACAERTPWVRRVQLAIDLVDGLTTRHAISLSSLAGLGVGIVGPVPSDRAGLVRDALAGRFGVPVFVDNNTRLAALAEATWGAAAGVESVLYLRLSYGVGGGLVLGGRLLAGAGGAAGELGHISVDRDGPRCSCGGRGCLERYLASLLDEYGGFDELIQAAGAMKAAGTCVGEVLAAACNTVNPEVVVIGGELTGAGEDLFRPLRAALRGHTHTQVHRSLRVTQAELGYDAAARGGIALVLTNPPEEAEWRRTSCS
ncbi:putative NBD/HSP70 family sugar kinase [Kribbella rubisoli]|uniref:NBD/HSP70 family sugar kinase n=1 Tax=Kribbella rubisoli TaxID=3075929 RepID=A0A4Q7WJU0_9ACTN|nr:ROK family protein [Kribbella rubisoli]RZU10260.1 putative NBD/HSP70 family sugar kinase [Kribbella rubisoli]